MIVISKLNVFLTPLILAFLVTAVSNPQVKAAPVSTAAAQSAHEAKAGGCQLMLALIDKYVGQYDSDDDLETSSVVKILVRDAPVLFGPEYQTAFFQVLERYGISFDDFHAQVGGFTKEVKIGLASQIWSQLLAQYPAEENAETNFVAAIQLAKRLKTLGVNLKTYMTLSGAINEVEQHPVFKSQALKLIADSLEDYAQVLALKKEAALIDANNKTQVIAFKEKAKSVSEKILSKKIEWDSANLIVVTSGAFASALIATIAAAAFDATGAHTAEAFGAAAVAPFAVVQAQRTVLSATAKTQKAYYKTKAWWLERRQRQLNEASLKSPALSKK